MSKHTPGPWRVIETDDAVMIGPDQFMTATYIIKASGFESSERRANAHLIAAAPEMLEALEDLRRFVWSNSHLKALDELIAKAKGNT